jgi:glycosyltransferase involved in cell wall biosynthesis
MTVRRRRAVVLVGNPARPYSRAVRLARTLVGEGYDVEIAATYEEGAPLEERDGDIVLRRYPPSGRFARLAASYGKRSRGPERGASTAEPEDDGAAAPQARPPMPVRVFRTQRARLIEWLFWPQTVRGYWATLARDLEPADLYHACGALPIAAALAARARDRRAGRASKVIFDVIDITLESNNVLKMPALVRRLLARRERGWGRAADAHTSVNETFADWAASHWQLARRPTVVPNYPQPWTPPPGPWPDRIREATGLPATTRICLFWGRLGPYVGLDEAAEAVLQVPNAAFVLLGFGRGWDRSVARDHDPRYAGRHFTLPAVHPDELPSWVASADVAMNSLPPLSYSQRHTTLNKFLEAMTPGTPMVLGPDLPGMEAILRKEDLGRVAASMDPRDIAAAVRDILDRPAEERWAWRERIRSVASERYSWPIAAAAYQELVRDLRPG